MNDIRDAAAPRPGPHNPVAGTPPRAPDSIRRTTTADISFPHGIGGPVTADVRGQDVRTNSAGDAEVTDDLRCDVHDRPGHRDDRRVDVTAANESLDALVGLPLRGGFARRLIELLPDDSTSRSLCYSAIENVGGAYLVSGYAGLRTGATTMTPEHSQLAMQMQADVCIGWALGRAGHRDDQDSPDATPCRSGQRRRRSTATTRSAGTIRRPLAPTSVRRRRRTDVRAAARRRWAACRASLPRFLRRRRTPSR